MFEVKAADAKRFLDAFDAEIEKLRGQVTRVYRGYAAAAFNYVLRETPQWSGNAAANWNFDLGRATYHVDITFRDIEDSRPQPAAPLFSKQSPNEAALLKAAKQAMTSYNRVTLDSTIYINNAAEDLSGKKYIQYLEENPGGYLRAVNEPGHMVERCETTFNALSPSVLWLLADIKPGDINNRGLV